MDGSKIYPGTVRDYWVYVPAQYKPDQPACTMVFQDGGTFINETGLSHDIVFDNLIHQGRPAGDHRSVHQSRRGAPHRPETQPRFNRSYEYDAVGDRYPRFLMEEILPEVGKLYNLSSDPNDRGIAGSSSGGNGSFNAAWSRPDAFHRVLSFIGGFTNLRGDHIYPSLVRKMETKPLRVFLQDGTEGRERLQQLRVVGWRSRMPGTTQAGDRNRRPQQQTRLRHPAGSAALALA